MWKWYNSASVVCDCDGFLSSLWIENTEFEVQVNLNYFIIKFQASAFCFKTYLAHSIFEYIFVQDIREIMDK